MIPPSPVAATRTRARPIPPGEYDRSYYLDKCEGFDEFKRSGGVELPAAMQVSFRAAAVRPGQRLLDVGCGRGELILNAARAGATAVGVDYSPDAVRIAGELFEGLPADLRGRLDVRQADAGALPFADREFDVVTWLDVIEHLTPGQVDRALGEIHRVLVPGGRLVVHTQPNLWYYRYGYYLWRLIGREARRRWPASAAVAYREARHINEQSPVGLWKALRAHGFRSRVWLETQFPTRYRCSRLGHAILLRTPPLKWVFARDLYAVAVKSSGGPAR